MWSAWSSGRRSGGCIGSRGCRCGRSAGGRGWHRDTVARRWRRASRRGMCGRRRGRSSIRSRTGSVSSLQADPWIQSQRLREMASELGYAGGKSIFDDYVREVRPRFRGARTFQRTVYRPGELVQCDLWEPSERIPVGHGQSRRGWVVTSRGVLVARDRRHPDLLQGGAGHPAGAGALPRPVGGVAGEAGLGS